MVLRSHPVVQHQAAPFEDPPPSWVATLSLPFPPSLKSQSSPPVTSFFSPLTRRHRRCNSHEPPHLLSPLPSHFPPTGLEAPFPPPRHDARFRKPYSPFPSRELRPFPSQELPPLFLSSRRSPPLFSKRWEQRLPALKLPLVPRGDGKCLLSGRGDPPPPPLPRHRTPLSTKPRPFFLSPGLSSVFSFPPRLSSYSRSIFFVRAEEMCETIPHTSFLFSFFTGHRFPLTFCEVAVFF